MKPYFLLPMLVALFALSAGAQTTTTAPVTVQRAVSATALRAVVAAVQNATNAASARKATNTSETMPPKLTNAIHEMSFDRSSESLFEAVKSQQSGGKLSESEKFRLALLLGDWKFIGAALKTLPEEDAMTAYTRLLDALTTNSQSAAQF